VRRLASPRTALQLGVAAWLGLAWAPSARAQATAAAGAPPIPANPTAVASLLDPIVVGHAGAVGVAVYSVDYDRALYLHDADTPLLPASNMKLYTTAAALDRLGPDFQYTTSLYADGPIYADGTLDGDLIVVGRGDPTISGRFFGDSATYVFDTFAAELHARGVKRVRGRLIGDASYFDETRIGPGWESGNLLWWYGARVSALSFNDNVVTIEVRPGARPGDEPEIRFIPAARHLTVENHVRTVGRRGGRGIGISALTDVDGYQVRGRIPVGSVPLRYVVAVDDPSRYALSVLEDRLARVGITVDDGIDVVHRGEPLPRRRPWTLVSSYTSPRLLELVRVVNKKSHNLFAEQLLKTLGAVFEGRGTFYAGQEVVHDFVRGIGVPDRALQIADGSGLSRIDRTTARTTARLLVAMRAHPEFEDWYESLLEAGVDGNPYRLDAPAAQFNVHAKTGTLRGVSALSGYVTTRDGELLAFSVMTNGLRGGKGGSIAIEDAVAERLARYSAWDAPLLQTEPGK